MNFFPVSYPFSTSQRVLILKAIENVQAVLKERGLDPLPVELYKYYGRMQEYGVPDEWKLKKATQNCDINSDHEVGFPTWCLVGYDLIVKL